MDDRKVEVYDQGDHFWIVLKGGYDDQGRWVNHQEVFLYKNPKANHFKERDMKIRSLERRT